MIELMIVIVVIAVLATFILIALGGARDSAENSRRKGAISQIKNLGEVYYAMDFDYSSFEEEREDFQNILDEYGSEGEAVLHYYVSDPGADAYCAEIELIGGAYFCVDSNLITREGHEDPRCTGISETSIRCDQ